MVNEIKDRLTGFLASEGKRVKVIVIIGVVGIILIMLSGLGSSGSKSETKTDTFDYAQYTNQLENELADVISSIAGVGECRVMITLENTSESVYATDSEFKNDDNSINQKDKYVIYDARDGETPVLIKEYLPKVMGVTVVCSGGDRIEIREKIIEAVTALFNISANRVSVSKIKS